VGGRCNSVRAVHRITNTNTNANANGDCDRDSHSYSHCNGYANADADTYTEDCSNTKASSHAAASTVVRLIAGGLMI